MTEADPEALNAEVRAELAKQLAGRGLQPNQVKGWVALGSEPVAVLAGVQHCAQQGAGVVVGLGFEVMLPEEGDAVIRETTAGFGQSRAQALAVGVAVFVEGVLEVLLGALRRAGRQADPTLRWTGRGTGEGKLAFDVYPGPVQVGGAPPARKQVTWVLTQAEPFRLVADRLAGKLADRPLHWLKLYLARSPAGEVAGEALLDNEPCPDALEQLRRFPWPAVEGFAHFRVFVALRKHVPAPAPAEPGPEPTAKA